MMADARRSHRDELRTEHPADDQATLPDDLAHAGGRWVPDDLPPRFTVQRQLGQGGFGAVYLATDALLGRRVALKVLTRETADAATRAQLLQEARTLAAVSHPHVVKVLDVLSLGTADVLVMEFVPGGSLGDVLDVGRLQERTLALRWLSELAAGLAAVHAAGILHRDLKPDNVLLDEDGSVRLGDFGLASRAGDHAQPRGGSLGYAPPEILLGEAPTDRSDLYAFGVVAWELLAGRRAFRAMRTRQVLAAQVSTGLPSVSEVAIDLPAPVRDAIDRCLEPDPRDRPAGAHALRSVFEPYGRGATAARTLAGLGMLTLVGGGGVLALALLMMWSWGALPDQLPGLGWRNLKHAKLVWTLLVSMALAGHFALKSARSLATATSGSHAAGARAPWRQVVRSAMARPTWWPTWYPWTGASADVERLPKDIRVFRVFVWIALPLKLYLSVALLVLALGIPPRVGLDVLRLDFVATLVVVGAGVAWLVWLVSDLRESPVFDAFELAMIAVWRPVEGDVDRLLPSRGLRDAEARADERSEEERLRDALHRWRLAATPTRVLAGALATAVAGWLLVTYGDTPLVHSLFD